MNAKQDAISFLLDAQVIFSEALLSQESGHFHRVMRKCQESTELAAKAVLLHYSGEYPKKHFLEKALVRGLAGQWPKERLERLAFLVDSLALERETAFYGNQDGIPAALLYEKEDGEYALAKCREALEMAQSAVQKERDR